MKTNIRCQACGRRRKPSHEKLVGTDKAYSKNCKKYEEVRAEIDKTKQEKSKKAAENAAKLEAGRPQREITRRLRINSIERQLLGGQQKTSSVSGVNPSAIGNRGAAQTQANAARALAKASEQVGLKETNLNPIADYPFI